jgi:hypothetical protein
MKVNLTDVGIRALTPPDAGQYTVWDKASPLGVRVSDGGAKTFIVMVGSGKRRTIGKVGIITLSDARVEAKRILAEKTLGIEKAAASTITFGEALPLFLEDNYKGRRPRSKSEAKRLLEKHFLPALRTTLLSDITDKDVGRQLDKLSDVPSEQLHAFRAIRKMLRWCTKPPRRYISHSPLEGYDAPSKDRKGKRILSETEIVQVWAASLQMGMFGGMVRLLFLWGARSGEVARSRRTWIADGVMTIPGDFTKNHRDHATPLLPMARAVLAEQTTNSDFFFPGRWDADTHFADGSWGKKKRELDKLSGVQKWQIRDIRRTFRSALPKLGVAREVAERLLNHVSGENLNDLDEIYNLYEFLDEKRAALEKWEAYLTHLLAAHTAPARAA